MQHFIALHTLPGTSWKGNLFLFLTLSFFLLNPVELSAQSAPPIGKDFAEIQTYWDNYYAGKPMRGGKKRWNRIRHYLADRLDEYGQLVNTSAANYEEMLRLQTWPGIVDGNWELYGPQNTVIDLSSQEGIGRVNCIAFEDSDSWYVGTPNGGLWRTDNAAVWFGGPVYSWECLTDDLPALAINDVLIHPDDPDTLYILTGDGFGTGGTSGPSVSGIGIMKSADRGASWEETSVSWDLSTVRVGTKMVMDPSNPRVMLAATSNGLLKTEDGWETSTSVITSGRIWDIEFKPGSSDTIYATGSGILYRSVNGGDSFSDITSNMAFTMSATRMELTVTADNPERVYLIASQSDGGMNTLQSSIDGGDSFIELYDNSYNLLARQNPVAERDGQGEYDLAFWVSPLNEDLLMVGGIDLWESTTAGLFWSKLCDDQDGPPNYIHADIHALEYNPFSGELFACTDGGLWISDNFGNEWSERGWGLAITQFYDIDVYENPLFGPVEVGGGTQDNGTMIDVLGIDPGIFQHVAGGDGFRMFRAFPDGTIKRYVEIQNGKIEKQTYIGESSLVDVDEITPDEGKSGDDYLGAWETPYQPHPSNFDELVAGYRHLYYNSDGDNDWNEIIINPPGAAYPSGTLIEEIIWSGRNANQLEFYVGDDNNGGPRDLWTCDLFMVSAITSSIEVGACQVLDLDSITGTSQALTDIELSELNEKESYFTIGGYVDGNKIYRNYNTDSTQWWENISFNLPNVPANCVSWDVDGIYLGNDLGVFYLPHGDSVWIYFSEGLPTVPVFEIEITESTFFGKKLFAGTFGRGIWTSDPAPPVRRTRWYVDVDATAGANDGSSWSDAFIELQDALDVAFPGDSIWVAEGIYVPVGASRDSSFRVSRFNVKVYGGFNATETQLSERNSDLNLTITSGDIGVIGDNSDNLYHVWRFDGSNAGAYLSGFTIQDGNANGSGKNSYGGGVFYDNINQSSGKPVIDRCVFIGNNASIGGGGMYFLDQATGDDPFYLDSCSFISNTADIGGGFYLE
jgi:hypothetical protein